MTRQILEPEQNYTFSDYFRFNYTIKDILKELGCSYKKEKLLLPTQEYDFNRVKKLQADIEFNLERVIVSTEDARKQIIIAPIFLELCRILPIQLNIEYTINVGRQLKGTVDYYIDAEKNFIVVEAKQVDLVRGFTQLAVELIALDQWIDSESSILYGAVTTGETWRFGIYHRKEKKITEDLDLYVVPKELNQLLNILLGILS